MFSYATGVSLGTAVLVSFQVTIKLAKLYFMTTNHQNISFLTEVPNKQGNTQDSKYLASSTDGQWV